MRFPVPSVASEVQNVLTARAQLPSNRSLGDTEARQPAIPFADLLDGGAPAGDPPPRPARSDRADRTSRSDTSNATDDRNADAAAANDRADARSSNAVNDAQNVRNTEDARSAKDAKVTKNARDARDAEDTKDAAVAKDRSDTKEALAADIKAADAKDAATAKDAAAVEGSKQAKKANADQTAPADGNAKLDTDKSAALDAITGDALQTVTARQSPVAAANEVRLPTAGIVPNDAPNAETDALAAVQTASPQIGAAKPVQVAGNRQGNAQVSTQDAQGTARGTQGAQGDAPAKGAPAVDPQKTPQIEGANEEQPYLKVNSEAAAGGFKQKLANLAGKADAEPRQTLGDAAGAVKVGADAMQSLAVATQANATNAAANAAANAPAPAQVAAGPLAGLAVEIATQATAGKNHFEIRLDPPELGRVDVKLAIDHDGRVTSHLVVDRTDTLDLLKRDAGDLQRALQQAGLKTSDNALEFSLRQQDFSRDDIPAQNATQLIVPDDDPAPLDALPQGYGRFLGLGGGLDIRV
jgi:chemotaxis protein MotD